MQLCSLLAERNWRIMASSRRRDQRLDIPGVVSEYLPFLTESASWQQALRSVDCVVHLAALVHQIRRDPALDHEFVEINIEGSRFLAEQSARAGVKRFVFLSSSKVNGEGNESRAYRADDVPAPEDSYARSKLAAELAISEVCDRSAMELVIVRSPLIYGPGVRANFARLMKISATGLPLPLAGIKNCRSMVGVTNLVDFLETCMRHPKAAGHVWLVSDGEDLSTPDMIRRLACAMRRPARLFAISPSVLQAVANFLGRGEELARLCNSLTLDSQPARDILDWEPPLSVDEGFMQTVNAFFSQVKK